jgi:hypothetical protein
VAVRRTHKNRAQGAIRDQVGYKSALARHKRRVLKSEMGLADTEFQLAHGLSPENG